MRRGAVPDEIGGSLAQLGVNLAGMTASGTATLAVQRALTRRPLRHVLRRAGETRTRKRLI